MENTIFLYARRGLQHMHHFLFTSICENNSVIPKGLVVKKTSCIFGASQGFRDSWEDVKQQSGHNFVSLLKKEHLKKTTSFQRLFWEVLILFMEGLDISSLLLTFKKLMDLFLQIGGEYRDRKLHKFKKLILFYYDFDLFNYYLLYPFN